MICHEMLTHFKNHVRCKCARRGSTPPFNSTAKSSRTPLSGSPRSVQDLRSMLGRRSETLRQQSAIIVIMDVGDIRLYKERWKAVEEIERQELRAMTLEEHWRKLNAIARFAIEAGMETNRDDSEMEVFLRWAELKARYEAG